MVKQKNRYALIEIIPGTSSTLSTTVSSPDSTVPSPTFTTGQIFYSVMERVIALHGDYGAGVVRASLHAKVVDGDVCVLRMPSSNADLLLTSLPFVRHIAKQPVTIQLLFCGRSIRSCEKRMIRIRRKELSDAIAAAADEETKQSIIDCIKRVEVGASAVKTTTV